MSFDDVHALPCDGRSGAVPSMVELSMRCGTRSVIEYYRDGLPRTQFGTLMSRADCKREIENRIPGGHESRLDFDGLAQNAAAWRWGEEAERDQVLEQLLRRRCLFLKPRYLMASVGRRISSRRCARADLGQFDAWMPTRHAANAQLFYPHGVINIPQRPHRQDTGQIE